MEVIVDDATQYWLVLDTGEISHAATIAWSEGIANAIKSTLQGLGLEISEVTYRQETLEAGDTWPQTGNITWLN